MVRCVLAGQGLVRVVLVSLCVVVCGGVVGVGPALAGVSRFGSEGQGAGQISGEPAGIAVEQESGDVYVADRNNSRVEKFGGEGAFLFAWGWGVADGHTKALQRCTSVCFEGVSGVGGGQFSSFAEGVAVDNDPLSSSHGDVYVFDIGNNRVEKFDSAGGFLLAFGHEVNEVTHGNVCLVGESCQAGTRGTSIGEFQPEGGDNIAVGLAGTVYVGDENRVQEFSPGGVYEGQIALPGTGRITALAVDSSSDVYVKGSALGGVRKYNGAGVELGAPRDASGEPFALAVGPADELFIDNGLGAEPHHILEYDPAGNEVASFDAGLEGGYRGIAFGDSIGELYVLNMGAVRLVGPPPAGPLLVAGSDSAGELQPTTATLSATLNPEGRETSYHFEYGTSVAYGTSTLPGTLTAGFEDQPVSVGLSGLQPRTAYHFRVVASNSAGTMFGPDETFVTLPPVLIDSESVSQVTSNSATLAAQINPLGVDTRFRFEYGPSTAYGTSVPVPDGDVGSGTVDVAQSALIAGLSPGTVYHYRVVAYNSLGTVEGPDRAFVTQSGEAPGLLDGRAWELVSPPDKHGAALEAINSSAHGAIQAARGGGAISYLASGPVDGNPAGNRNIAFTQVLSTRGGGGWVSRGIATPNEPPVVGLITEQTGEYRWFSDDLSVGLVEPSGVTPLSPAASERTLYLREGNGEYMPLVTAANVPLGTEFGKNGEKLVFEGATRDLSHVAFSSPKVLTPGFASGFVAPFPGDTSLYEWAGGSLRLVSVLPDGKPAAEEGEGQPVELGHAGSGGAGTNANARHAVSEDGSRIFWSTSAGSEHLYMRDMNLGKTVQLDAVQEGALGGIRVPVFQTASSDGSKVFFTDEARLTVDATSGPGKLDLYMCEIGEVAGRPTCALKDLTVDENAGEAASVEGVVLGASEDGRYVYFVADGVLAAGATPGGCTGGEQVPPSAVCNLYVYDTVANQRRFIATLSGEDSPAWAILHQTLLALTARVSPDGRYLAFMSDRSLTGYDNIDVHSGRRDEEVFLYDVGAGRVVCASCNPSGARPTGVFDPGTHPGLLVDHDTFSGGAWSGHWLAASIPGWTATSAKESAWYQSRYLSDSGRLFFNAADALVPRDTNGREDVYEYEPNGVGGCTRVAGCVGLMSAGTSGEESAFLDASESGDEVFFLTASRQVSQDVDGSLDVYDARVCSVSSPCLASPPVPAAPCGSGDSCRGGVSSQSEVFGAPSSMGVTGAGNLTPPVRGPAVKGRRVSRAQKLASALRACRKRPRHRRASCRAGARRLYGSGVKAKRAGNAVATRKGNR